MENWIERIGQPQRLILAWQAPRSLKDRFRWAVGDLLATPQKATFGYFSEKDDFPIANQGRSFSEIRALGFEGYPAFRLGQAAGSVRRFDDALDVFMRRLPPRNRPDFPEFLRHYRLLPTAILSDFSLLARTEAKLPSDGFSLVDPLDPGQTECDLLLEVAGYRSYQDAESTVLLGRRVDITAETDNPHDPLAVQIQLEGRKIGTINRLQAPTFRAWLEKRSISAVIERLNGSSEAPRASLFIRVRPLASSLAA